MRDESLASTPCVRAAARAADRGVEVRVLPARIEHRYAAAPDESGRATSSQRPTTAASLQCAGSNGRATSTPLLASCAALGPSCVTLKD